MAVPETKQDYESFTLSLITFEANLAADRNPAISSLALIVASVMLQVDERWLARRDRLRDELQARRRRDHEDALGDDALKLLRRELLALLGAGHPAAEVLFPVDLSPEVDPRGAEQVQRREALLQRWTAAENHPDLAGHALRDRVLELLASRRAGTEAHLADLRTAVEVWQKADLALDQARRDYEAAKERAAAECSATLGELRKLLGGDVSAANEYTEPGRRSRKSAAAPAPPEPPAAPAPVPPPSV